MDLEQIIRKVLLVNTKSREWRQVLPRLTESDKTDQQLYAFFALAVRQFVSSWHTRIIDDDPQFLYDLCDALAHVTKTLESRLTSLLTNQRLDDIILDDIPYILQCHIEDIRVIRDRKAAGLIPEHVTTSEAFHAIRPLKSLDQPLDHQNEALFIKLLSQGLTKLVLDPKDSQSKCASSFISSILGDIVLKNVIERLAQPWTWHELILKVADIFEKKRAASLEIKKQKEMMASTGREGGQVYERMFFVFDPQVPLATQLQQLQKRAVEFSSNVIKASGRALAYVIPLIREAKSENEQEKGTDQKPQLVDRVIFSCFVSLLKIQQRSPLIVDIFHILSALLRGDRLGVMTSRFASSLIQRNLANEDLIVTILDNTRRTLFSNDGYMGPPRIIPTPEEQLLLRDKALQSLVDACPELLAPFVYGKDSRETVDEILSLLDDVTINKHLIYELVEYLFMQLFPELGDSSIGDLS